MYATRVATSSETGSAAYTRAVTSQNRLLIAIGSIPIITAIPLMAYAISRDDRAIAVPIGFGLIVLPSLLLKRIGAIRVVLWQLLLLRFVLFGPGSCLIAFGLGARLLVAVAIGAAAGLAWAALWFVQRPGVLPRE